MRAFPNRCGDFLFSPKEVFAQVVINKFSSDNGTDWVEVYNTGGETVDLTNNNYQLRDTSSSGNPKNLDCLLPGSGHYSIDWGISLNKNGDRIVLLKGEEMADCVAYGDGNGFVCEGKSQVDLEKLEPGEYGIRDPAGTGVWAKTTDSTKVGDSECLTSLPSPSPSFTPTPTPSPSTATYKINEVKDENGDVLSSVKVYLDDVYLHHHAPETLTFCDGCQCDTYVDCGFGEHTIKLEKSGFGSWSETKTIDAGDSYEVNPIMTPSGSASSPTNTPTPSPTPTPSLTGVELSQTLTGEILGEESSPRGIYLLESPSPSPEVLGEETTKSPIWPKIFLVGGSIFLFAAAISLWYTQLRPSKPKTQSEQEDKIID